MLLLVAFVVLSVVGQAINFAIAIQIERFSEIAGVIVFFALLVTVFVVAWHVAVRITEPKPGQPTA